MTSTKVAFLADSSGVTTPIDKEVPMSDPASRIFGVVVAFALLFAWSPPAFAQIQNDLEAQMAVMDEAVAGVSATLIEFTGQCDPTAKLDYHSFFNGPNGHGYLKGTYAGKPVDVKLDSFFDVATDSSDLQLSGVGADVDFSGGGPDVSSFDQTRMIQLVNVKANGTVPWDFHISKNYSIKVVTWGTQIIDDGLVVITRLGRPIAEYRQTSIFRRYFPFRRTLETVRIAPSRACKATLKGLAQGNSISGTVKMTVQ
jgi:hypothetical protein